MSSKQPLCGETVIFTSTKKSEEPYELVRQLGGEPVSLPLIRTTDRQRDDDHARLLQAQAYDWLIFTSQSAVAAFKRKLGRSGMDAESFPVHVAAVGEKTAAALRELGFGVDFIPDVFSADVFVKQFNPAGRALRALFLKGNLAGSLISTELSLSVDEWTVYDTVPETASIKRIVDLARQDLPLSILFASPSAVSVFGEYLAPQIGWTGFTIGAIGHITERALMEAGAHAGVMPSVYTLPELVRALAESKGRN
ncbi:uroporphyrinogen-III synthase [Sporosarcina trichiuri]|uniref:uroporphyrinogen-III synthase n=1 Tax=Sporosarcina trichiuri TaxID=3056445 RepID=UPI0025B48C84|nr:uroporphyrinogen-III synthase [Sporosarcina sp. 0.2-SM1T-5]WJY28155.1 uroporphyrinogen-III synthase [Sporosarcina sp. 0.2-SM1T-5]